ncbi:MAG: thymidine phosphorylase [Anaerolineae bacterium]|jgi:pyrimidine-nucleoside phosphorylase|nr:thymidine phosphorylase [Chloroflexota bacterium]
MDAVKIIERKRDGATLDPGEIQWFIKQYSRGAIPDYQAAALAMAIYFQGMSPEETVELTLAMVHSGDTLDLAPLGKRIVDKHSTGGVGDKTTLVVSPLVAALGLTVAKMSGRGLGFSGGTLDKLESIPGYRTGLTADGFLRVARQASIAVVGQTAELVPADGKLYALRDVTGTVPSLPLIASSIMSKKIAGGAHAMVLDVKVGRGAFMETLDQARELAQRMIAIGQGLDRAVTAVLSDMNQPLGRAIGNSLEVIEAIETLKGRGPQELVEHCLAVATEMVLLGREGGTPQAVRAELAAALESGRALECFARWIAAQGGDARVVDDYALLPASPVQLDLPAQGGYLAELDARAVAMVTVDLGAGRHVKEDPIDHGVGIVLHAAVGDYVTPGAPLLTIHAASDAQATAASRALEGAARWTPSAVRRPPVVLEILRDPSVNA